MKTINKWFILLLFVLMTGSCWSQTSVLTENFELGTLPLGWSQSPSIGVIPWRMDSLQVFGNSTVYEGNNCASIRSGAQEDVMLLTPLVNISSLNHPTLSFAALQPKTWSGVHDALVIYVRPSLSGSWIILDSIKSENGAWDEVLIDLCSLNYTEIGRAHV